MYSYRSPAAKDLAPDTHGSISRRRMSSRLLARAPLAVGVALALAGAVAQAADGAKVVFQSNLIGLDRRPAGVQNSGPNQINHVPDPDDPVGNRGTSQALVIDFGQDVTVTDAELGGLVFGERGCNEAGRWTAFDAAGAKLADALFVAKATNGEKLISFSDVSLRYLAFSAEPYSGEPDEGCDVATIGSSDSSDYLIKRLSFMFDGEEKGIPNDSDSFVDPLEQSNFLAYDPDEPFTDTSGNLIDPDGERLGTTSTIVIEPQKCEGGSGDGSATSCDIELVEGRFTSTFENADDISGTLKVRATKTIDDDRHDCADPGSSGDAGKLYLNSDLNVVATADDAAIIVPSYLCGIPVEGQPQFTLIELESTLTVRESVITHTVEDPEPDPDLDSFQCVSDDRSKQPVIGWLPRAEEIPVIGPDGMRSLTMEDVTTGCGSTRGSTFRMSYLLFDLRHLPGTDYQSVVAGEFEQLRVTFRQFAACVNNGTLTSTVESSVDKAARWFDRGRRDKATGELIKLRSEAENFNSRLGRDLPSCFWNEEGGIVIAADPDAEMPGDGIEPRNARGDLLTQIDHILYMIESKFGDVQAPDGASEVPQSQGKAKSNGKNKKQ